MSAKQLQHHGPRAPRGRPEQTRRLGARVSEALYRKFLRKGGSAWLRRLIKEA